MLGLLLSGLTPEQGCPKRPLCKDSLHHGATSARCRRGRRRHAPPVRVRASGAQSELARTDELAAVPPGPMFLLTDGTVIVQDLGSTEAGSPNWWARPGQLQQLRQQHLEPARLAARRVRPERLRRRRSAGRAPRRRRWRVRQLSSSRHQPRRDLRSAEEHLDDDLPAGRWGGRLGPYQRCAGCRARRRPLDGRSLRLSQSATTRSSTRRR